MTSADHSDPPPTGADCPDGASRPPGDSGGTPRAAVADDERDRKRAILTWFTGLAILPLTAYTVEDLVAGRIREGSAEAAIVIVLGVSFVAVRAGRSPVAVGRWVVGVGLAVLTWELAIGGGDGFAMLWFFVFPLVALFILGAREGAVFVGLSIVLVVLFAVVLPVSRAYYEQTGFRLVVTYAVVSGLAWTLESSRSRYDQALRREKAELEQALREIETLQRMLPICAWCGKVRDDEGYWSGLEAYLGRRGDLRFTHGICPECASSVRENEIDADGDGSSGART